MKTRDSAGRPWEGRTFDHHGQAFRDDDGSAPAEFSRAIAALHRGEGDVAGVVGSLRGARLLVPLVTSGEVAPDASGREREKTQELSIVTVQAPDGSPILPMFASAEAMRQWKGDARPVPVTIERAAAAALDGPGRIIIDPASASAFVLQRTALVALAAGIDWQSPLHDAAVQAAVCDAMFAQPAVEVVIIASGDPRSTLAGAELEAHVVVSPDPGALEQVRSASEALQESALLREQVASVAIRLHRLESSAEVAALPLVVDPVVAVRRCEHDAMKQDR